MLKDFGGAIALGVALLLNSSVFAIEPDGPEELATKLDGIALEIQERLSETFRSTNEATKRDRGALVSFYSDRNFVPIWIDNGGLNAKAQKVIGVINRAEEFGLERNDFDLPRSLDVISSSAPLSVILANAELKVSFAVLTYARIASGGRIDPDSLKSKYIDQSPELPDPLEVIETISDSSSVEAYLIAMHPQHRQFQMLKKELARQRSLKNHSNRVRIPTGRSLKPGMEHPHVALLRQRLENDYPEIAADQTDDPDYYDEDLLKVVKKYQKDNGLFVDGFVGPSTKRALNGTKKSRIKTILANMERWRWMPRDLGAMHIRVNIPEYRFRVMKSGAVIHEERMVAGKVTNQTPIFSDQMETVVFNPYWYPPKSIIQNEILPGARKNPGFVARNGLQVSTASGRRINPASVDWYSARPGQVFFRQPPGPRNVLGEIKFLFPNKHQVYMHDTPSKHLFKRQVRAYSHGCMRVRDPRRLAEVVLANEPGWSKGRIAGTIAAGENYKVTLASKLPVHVSYFTAWVDEQDQVRYANDIYGHDRKVLAAFAGRPIPKDPADPLALAERRRAELRRIKQNQPPSIQDLFSNIFGTN